MPAGTRPCSQIKSLFLASEKKPQQHVHNENTESCVQLEGASVNHHVLKVTPTL